MIITPKLTWVHLPKLLELQLISCLLLVVSFAGVIVRHASEDPRHRCIFLQLPLGGDQFVSNFRRLHWLLVVPHKLQHMGLKLDSAPMAKGLFWRNRDKEWLPADWWLERFGIDERWILLRVEYLKNDFLSCLKCYEPIDTISRLRFVLMT